MIMKMNQVTSLLVFVLVLLSTSSTSAQSPNVILISWDGVQRAHLYDLLERGELPNLHSLMERGGIAPITITDHFTDTKSGHAEMLTGYPPRITGVWNNRTFKPIPEGYTLFERLENHFSERIVTVMLTGKTHNLGGERGEPYFKAKRSMDVFDSNAAHADVVGPKAVEYVKKYRGKQFFAFFHFSDSDSAGHTFGENSKEYEDAIKTCDRWLGEIVEELKVDGLYGKTILYVTSDHGVDEGRKTHNNAPYVFICSSRNVKGGDQKDIVPTILQDYGVNISQIRPKLPGKSLVDSPSSMYMIETWNLVAFSVPNPLIVFCTSTGS